MSSEVKARVIEIITKSLQPDDPKKVTLEARLVEDLGADSLDMVELVMALEEDLKVEITDDAAKNIKTVQDVISFIEAHQSKDKAN